MIKRTEERTPANNIIKYRKEILVIEENKILFPFAYELYRNLASRRNIV